MAAGALLTKFSFPSLACSAVDLLVEVDHRLAMPGGLGLLVDEVFQRKDHLDLRKHGDGRFLRSLRIARDREIRRWGKRADKWLAMLELFGG